MIRNATGNCFWKYDLDDEYRMTFLKQDPGEEEEVLMTFAPSSMASSSR